MIKFIVLDECLSPAIGRLLQLFIELEHPNKIQVLHLKNDLGFGSKRDDEWVPKLNRSEWLVITADLDRKKYGSGSPLPQIVREKGLRAVYLKGKLCQRGMEERARALICVWPDIWKMCTAPKHSTWALKISGGYFVLEEHRVRDRQPTLRNAGLDKQRPPKHGPRRGRVVEGQDSGS